MLVPSLRRPATIAGLVLMGASVLSAAGASANTKPANKAREFMHAMESSPAARKSRAARAAKSNLGRKIAAAAVPAESVPSYTASNTRRLDEQEQEDGEMQDEWANFGFEVSDYSLKYAGCSAVATYSDEMAENEEFDTVVSAKKFVVFRLCPTTYCSDDRTFGCSSNYGEYVLDMEEYLQFIREYKEEQMERFCEYCEECMNQDAEAEEEEQQEEEQEEEEEQDEEENEDQDEDERRRRLEDAAEEDEQADEEEQEAEEDDANDNENNQAAAGCADYDVCYNYANVCDAEEEEQDEENEGNNNNNNANGNYDLTEYFECQQAADGVYFVGPHCASDKATINIGVYADEECSVYVGDSISFENAMGFAYDDDALADYYDSGCTSCRESDKPYQNVDGDEEDEDDINELCENLYYGAAKCNRYMYDAEDESYGGYNQEANEASVCGFIQNVVTGQYDEYGYIYLDAAQYEEDNKANRYADTKGTVSIGQIFALLIMGVLCLILTIWACFLHRSLTRNAPWRPRLNKRAKAAGAISKSNSGIMMGRSRSGGSYQAPQHGQYA